LLEYLRIDDPIGAWPVHAAAGIWGTLSLGLLATGQYGVPTATGTDTSTVVRGLFYGGGGEQLFAQFIGSMTAVVVVTGTSLIILYVIRAIRGSWNLRLARDGELEGMDLHEHGTPAYHVEFGYGMSYSSPPSLPSNGERQPIPASREAEPV